MRLGTGLLLSLAVIAVILAPGLIRDGHDADDTPRQSAPGAPAGHAGQTPSSASTATDSAPLHTAALPATQPKPEPVVIRWPKPDVAAFREALAFYRAGNVGEGDAAAARIPDLATRETLEWIAIRNGGPGIETARIEAFTRRNPDWPGLEAMRRRIETQYLQSRPSSADITRTFTARPPVTDAGRLAWSRALADTGSAEQGLELARDLWRSRALSAAARRALLDTHGSGLTADDHRARLRTLLHAGQWDEAQETALRLGRDEPALVDAFIAATKRSADAGKRLDAVPDSLRTSPEYLLARSRFERRANDLATASAVLIKAAAPNKAAIETVPAQPEAAEPTAEADKAADADSTPMDTPETPTEPAAPLARVIAAPVPAATSTPANAAPTLPASGSAALGSPALGSPALGSAWALEQRMVARALLDAGKPKAAYDVAALPFATSDTDRIDAAFFAGWIALRFLDDADSAATHFADAAQHATRPISIARTAYWQGRAAQAAKDEDAARRFFNRAAEHSTTYYGQLARARLGLPDVAVRPLPEPSDIARRDLSRMTAAQAVRLLIEAEETDLLLPFLSHLAARLDHDHLAALAEVVGEAQDARASLALGKTASYRGHPFDVAAFPDFGIPEIEDGAVEGSMVYAITRQESAFNDKAVSNAGARGLMQLMPATARETAQSAGLPYDVTRLTSDPAYNARLGASYLGGLVDRWNGSYVLAIASYNAGPGNVRRWITAYGDPRSPDIDAVDWVERIPFSETRNYVQRVLENLQVYRHRLKNETALVIEQDLHRGRRAAP